MIKFIGDHADKWKVATDSNYMADTVLTAADWKDEIALSGVGAMNVVFWVKATSSSDEQPQSDVSVDLQAEGLLVSD